MTQSRLRDPDAPPVPRSAAAATTDSSRRAPLRGQSFDVQAAMLAPAPQLDAAQVQRHAAAGTRGGGVHLPYLDRIQAAFGVHDVSGIQAYVGGASKDASSAIGAQAYASGNKVAFAAQPDLHTAAHEAAHIVQQRGGVSVAGGVGQAGDRYEQHANQVADRVVQGKSAVDLLGAPGSGAGTSTVQMKPTPNKHAPAVLDVGLVHASPAAEPEVACGLGDDLTTSDSMNNLKKAVDDAIASVAWTRPMLELGLGEINAAFTVVQAARTKPDDTEKAERHRQLIEAEAESGGGFLSILSTIADVVSLVGAFRAALSAVKALATFGDVASAAKGLGVAVPGAAKSKATDNGFVLATTVSAQTKTVAGAAAATQESPAVAVDRMAETRLTALSESLQGLGEHLARLSLTTIIGRDIDILRGLSAAPRTCGGVASSLAIEKACGRHAIARDQAMLLAALEALDAALSESEARYAYFSDLLGALGAVLQTGDRTPLAFAREGVKTPGLRSLFEAVRADPGAYLDQVELIRAHGGYKVQLGPEFVLERGIDDHPASEGQNAGGYRRAHIPVRKEAFVDRETFHLRTTTEAGAEVIRLTLQDKAQASSTGHPEVELTPSEAAILRVAGIPTSRASADGAIVRPYVAVFTDLALSFGHDEGPCWWNHPNLIRFVQTYPTKFKAKGTGQSVPSDASIEMEKY